ncbi:MAG: hypothetical protein Q9163_004832 [Psora crenata]
MDKEISEEFEAVAALSQALKEAGIKHVIIGGQATRLLGNDRGTEDIDVLVDCPGLEARKVVAAKDSRFVEISHRMTFKTVCWKLYVLSDMTDRTEHKRIMEQFLSSFFKEARMRH